MCKSCNGVDEECLVVFWVVFWVVDVDVGVEVDGDEVWRRFA